MDGQKLVIEKPFFVGLAMIVVVALLFSAGVGVVMGNDRFTPPEPPETNTAENSGPGNVAENNTVENTNLAGSTTDNTGQSGSAADNTAANTGQGDTVPDNTPGSSGDDTDKQGGAQTTGKNIGGTGTINDPGNLSEFDTSDLSPQEIAAAMQDYTIDPSTGRAREIKIPDDNYLILINRTHPLADSYSPNDLREVKNTVSSAVVKGQTDRLRNAAAAAFDDMAAVAETQGIKIRMRVGYQSYEFHKTRIYDLYVKNYGKDYADTVSCEPGLSEHQTGLALNVAGASTSYELSLDFLNTAEGKWVQAHCWQYGFILRYTDGTPDGKNPGSVTGFVYEPYHLRYVGIKAATEIMEKGLTLEAYLGIFT